MSDNNKHTIANPLKLQWDGTGYNVNKPNIDHEILVSKSVADAMLEALKNAFNKNIELYQHPDAPGNIPKWLKDMELAIKSAQGNG